MRRAARILALGFLLLASPGNPGCRWGDPHRSPEELAVLPGLSVVEFDGVHVEIRREESHPGGLVLLVGGQPVEQAELRAGDRFGLSDGQRVNETYQLLLASEDRITMKRRQVFDRRAAGEGIRTVESVVALTPYNLEKARKPRLAEWPQ